MAGVPEGEVMAHVSLICYPGLDVSLMKVRTGSFLFPFVALEFRRESSVY